MRHDWRMIVCDALDGTELIELWQAQDRAFTRPLAGGAGAAILSGRIDFDNPATPIMRGPDAVERLEKLVKVYRDGELMMVTDLTTGEPAGDGNTETFAFAAAGPLITRINTGWVGGDTFGYARNTAPLTNIAHDIVRQVNDDAFNRVPEAAWTGVSTKTYAPVTAGVPTAPVEKLFFKRPGELLLELSQQLGGFDFDIEPEEPHEAPHVDEEGLQIGSLRTYAVRGAEQPNAVFEYGTGKRNMAAWRAPADALTMANEAAHLAPGFPDSVEAGVAPIVTDVNETTYVRRPRRDVIQADVQPAQLRTLLVEEAVRIRGYPRETIFVTPAPDADVTYGEHYREGDLITARAKSFRGRTIFDALFRVYGVEFAVDNMGLETVELALVNEAAQL